MAGRPITHTGQAPVGVVDSPPVDSPLRGLYVLHREAVRKRHLSTGCGVRIEL